MTMDRTDEIVAAAISGEESAFAALTERHRRELHVHCYRMLASFDEAEDAVQETFLRAWRSRDSFDGGSLFRAWLYRLEHIRLALVAPRLAVCVHIVALAGVGVVVDFDEAPARGVYEALARHLPMS
jgi:hypothetical protein